MVLSASNSMNMFQAGVAGGRTQGMSGAGGAIRGILEQARKVGLLGAQSAFQSAGANQVNIAKENRQAERDQDFINLHTVGVGGGTTSTPIRREDKVIKQPTEAVNPFADLEALRKLKEQSTQDGNAPQGGGNVPAGDTVTIQYNDGTSEVMTTDQAKAQGYI